MSEYMTGEVFNPYAVAPADGGMMADKDRHEGGNALAANAEARVVAEVKAQVMMARQFPRNAEAAVDNILRECNRATLAEAAVYMFPRGKEMVTGPSIRLAEVMARNWGNNTFGYETLERKQGTGRNPGVSVMRAFAWDLETNTYISRQFEIKHWRSTKSGGYAITDDRDIYELEANMASRRVRACILQMIPGDVTEMAVNACRKTTENKTVAAMSDPKKRAALIARVIKAFEGMGVTQDDLEGCLNCMASNWTADHVLKLGEIRNSLEDGTVGLGDYFPRLATDNQNTVVTKEQVEALMAAAKATGYQGKVIQELKKMGIAKFADVPAGRYEEVMRMIQGFGLPAKAEQGAIEAAVEETAEQMKME